MHRRRVPDANLRLCVFRKRHFFTHKTITAYSQEPHIGVDPAPKPGNIHWRSASCFPNSSAQNSRGTWAYVCGWGLVWSKQPSPLQRARATLRGNDNLLLLLVLKERLLELAFNADEPFFRTSGTFSKIIRLCLKFASSFFGCTQV